jgi:HTH-type transcriptional regulator / antitoxin HigA
MNLAFDAKRYADLLSRYQPKLIRTEEENREALAVLQELLRSPSATPEETELYRLMIALIEKFEEEYYLPSADASPDMLLYLMDKQQLRPQDLVKVFGSSEIAAEVVDGRRGISQAQAEALGHFFNVDPCVFV